MSDHWLPRVSDLEEWRRMNAEPALRRLTEGQIRVEGCIAEINAKLSGVATKADVSEAVNGLLGRALDAVPASHALGMQRRSLMWQVFAALVFAAGFGVTLLRYAHGG